MNGSPQRNFYHIPGHMELRRGWNIMGQSHQGRPIRAFANFDLSDSGGRDWTLFLGGTHGDERATVPFLETFIEGHLVAPSGLGPTAAIPVLNPDGYAAESRYNAQGVDLNRNFPAHWSEEADEPSGPKPLSEPEARLLHDLLLQARPARVVSLHWALSEIDADGEHSEPLAKGMWEALEEGQRGLFRLKLAGGRAPLPGSLGSFCRQHAEGKAVPALVTLELPYHPHPELDPLPDDHLETVKHYWRQERTRYWDAVYPAVAAMLRFAAGA